MQFRLLTIGLLLVILFNNKDNRLIRSNVEIQKPKTTKMDIQYAYTILYVSDVPKTIEFYKRTFGFEQKLLTPEKDYGEIESGSTTIAFGNLELGNSNFKKGFTDSKLSEKPFGIELAFTTLDAEKVMKKAIKNGAALLAETVTKPWGQQVGYVRDPNGFILEICSPIQN